MSLIFKILLALFIFFMYINGIVNNVKQVWLLTFNNKFYDDKAGNFFKNQQVYL